jgi:hypothetical protein
MAYLQPITHAVINAGRVAGPAAPDRGFGKAYYLVQPWGRDRYREATVVGIHDTVTAVFDALDAIAEKLRRSGAPDDWPEICVADEGRQPYPPFGKCPRGRIKPRCPQSVTGCPRRNDHSMATIAARSSVMSTARTVVPAAAPFV